ncbi:MAG TPA: transcriptional regulator [Candidatus Solibacter sp.]|nr:transcriptional regulator [Candidatus Solibacter sp.]
MKSDRLLSALLLLQAHGRMTGRAMAKRLEVSMRTVHRDMEALSAAGVPVFAMRGAQGGWQLDEDWRTQVPGLDEAELRALLMSQPRVIGDARLAAAAESALGKLMASLPAAMRERAASIRQRLHVDTAGWRGTGENLAMLPIVQEAVARDRRLAIRYWKADRELVERTVDALGLVAKGTSWYLFARTPRGMRTFRVSRIAEAKLLDETFERPANFDLAAAWKVSTDEFRDGRAGYEATFRVETRTAEWIKMWHSVTIVGEAGEWTTMRVRFHHEDEATFVALGLGRRAQVMSPAKLKERVRAEVAAMVESLREPAYRLE